MGLYTFLYENLLYRLYIIHIQPPRIVPARLSRYTAHTAYTAIQPYTPYIIQRYTSTLWTHPAVRLSSGHVHANRPRCRNGQDTRGVYGWFQQPSSDETASRPTYNLVLILTRHTLARAGLANRLF